MKNDKKKQNSQKLAPHFLLTELFSCAFFYFKSS